MTTVVLRHPHGLGDCLQLTAIINHLKVYQPEWEISTQTFVGTQDVFRGLVDRADGMIWPWQFSAEKVIYLHFARPQYEWINYPSTKVTQCLCEGDLKQYGIPPQIEHYRYSCSSTDEQREKVDRWKTGPYLLLHYQGNASPENKNLQPDDVLPLIDKAKAMGMETVILDWSGKEQWIGEGKAKGISEFWQWEGSRRFNYSDAGIIKELIAHAEMMVGIDSGPAHVAATTNTPTCVVWTKHHPYFFFDPCLDDNYTTNVLHFVSEDYPPLHPESQETFKDLYSSRTYLARWQLFEEQLPKLLEGWPEGDPENWTDLDWQPE
jgi:ADP-heptose:LPS heptosyltransferase